MKNNKIIILVGPSASGKDTIARRLENEYKFNFIISTTTRPIRPGESEKNPYYFLNNEEFINKINNNEMIEYREYHTLVNGNPDIWYYGAEKKEINENTQYVGVLDIIGLKAFKETFGDRVVSFFLNVSDDIRMDRCIKRGDFDESEWNRRLIDDKKVFAPEVIEEHVDWTVEEINSDIIVSKIMDITLMS